MSALFTQPLSLDVACDYQAILTVFSSSFQQLGIVGATATMLFQATSQDPAPLAQLSTTPSASGSLAFGVAPPPPSGLAASEQGAIAELGTAQTSAILATGLYGTVVAQVATVGALEALPTTGFVLGNVALVTAGAGSYFLWSPLDPSTPNGTTILAGQGGNWLLFGTIVVNLTAAAAAAFAGYDRITHQILVTWGNGAVTKLVEGPVFIRQTSGNPF